jgi:hypothetical protein
MSRGMPTRKRPRSPSPNVDRKFEGDTSTWRSSTDEDDVEECARRTFRQAFLKRLLKRFIGAGGGKLWVLPRKRENVSETFVLWHMLAAPHDQIKRLILADNLLYGGVKEGEDGYLQFSRKDKFWNALGIHMHINKYRDVEYWQLHICATSVSVGTPKGMGLVSFDDVYMMGSSDLVKKKRI